MICQDRKKDRLLADGREVSNLSSSADRVDTQTVILTQYYFLFGKGIGNY